MGRIFITRHGETLWNTLGKLQGWMDSPLTEMGIKQAEWLYERLKDEKIDYIYSSSSGRAHETAKILNRDRELEIVLKDEIREIGLGDWQGVEQKVLREQYGEMVDIYWTRPHEYFSETGESFQQVVERNEKFLMEIIKTHKDDDVLIVTHTVALKAMMMKLEGKEIKNLWEEPFIKQTSLTILEHDGESAKIIVHADASHHKEEYVRNPHY